MQVTMTRCLSEKLPTLKAKNFQRAKNVKVMSPVEPLVRPTNELKRVTLLQRCSRKQTESKIIKFCPEIRIESIEEPNMKKVPALNLSLLLDKQPTPMT